MRAITVVMPLYNSRGIYNKLVMEQGIQRTKLIYLSIITDYIYREIISMDIDTVYGYIPIDVSSGVRTVIVGDVINALRGIELLGNSFSRIHLDGVFTNETMILVISGI